MMDPPSGDNADPELPSRLRVGGRCLSDQVGEDQQDADLPRDPTRRSDANRTESIGRDIQASRREKYPCARRRPVSGDARGVDDEQGSNKLRKYLQQIVMSPYESTGDAADGSW